MQFEWDEAKRLANLAKHKLDFRDAEALFDHLHLIAPARVVTGETRWLAIGRIGAAFVTVVLTRRGNAVRVISMRRARHEEQVRYRALHGG